MEFRIASDCSVSICEKRAKWKTGLASYHIVAVETTIWGRKSPGEKTASDPADVWDEEEMEEEKRQDAAPVSRSAQALRSACESLPGLRREEWAG